MFYNYVKILYSILENYKADSDEFNELLKINNELIDNCKKKKQKQKQNLKQCGGTSHIAQLEEIKNEILENLQNLESKEKSIELQTTLNLIIDYINLLDELLQNNNLKQLSNQLQEMNEILETI